MNLFLKQFGLTPVQRIGFEQFIFAQADKMVEGYGGGKWSATKIGGVYMLVLPVSEKTVTLNNYAFGGGIDADQYTASAAFTSVVVNWFWHLRAEQGRLTDAQHEAFDTFSRKLRDAVYSDGSKVNTSDFFQFTD
jgi:hypothetical protein